ncbi:hypothetical protein EIN_424320 [Entamoeba invadens IP1]|uniref:Uncharacterized protein n=1 Tax=Entamoeba invadens IP1 TaxID=370355 RepID=A0A0A1U5Z7_ENTIV|nr:hypothetical protein EIN_424320 [Entamoeba invadens IP1]ELP89750.1 hypothetical protein EIN_424320 [Entamoeba invadens IP1]|eukprot:XP_004256521.1 hypothetical protein EIN_424320 [Entamoeba invadens IP1]
MDSILRQVGGVLKNLKFEGVSVEDQITLPLEILKEVPTEVLKPFENDLIFITSKLLEVIHHFESVRVKVFEDVCASIEKIIGALKRETVGLIVPGIVKNVQRVRDNGRVEYQKCCVMMLSTCLSFAIIEKHDEEVEKRLTKVVTRWYLELRSVVDTIGESALQVSRHIDSWLVSPKNVLIETAVRCGITEGLTDTTLHTVVEQFVTQLDSQVCDLLNQMSLKDTTENSSSDVGNVTDTRKECTDLINTIIQLTLTNTSIESIIATQIEKVAAWEVIIYSANYPIHTFNALIEKRVNEEVVNYIRQSEDVIFVVNGIQQDSKNPQRTHSKNKSLLLEQIESSALHLLVEKTKKSDDTTKSVILNEVIQNCFDISALQIVVNSFEEIAPETALDIFMKCSSESEIKEISKCLLSKCSPHDLLKKLSLFEWAGWIEVCVSNSVVQNVVVMEEPLVTTIVQKAIKIVPFLQSEDFSLTYVFRLLTNVINQSQIYARHAEEKGNTNEVINTMVHMMGFNTQNVEKYSLQKKRPKEEKQKEKQKYSEVSEIVENALISLTHVNSEVRVSGIEVLRSVSGFMLEKDVVRVMKTIGYSMSLEEAPWGLLTILDLVTKCFNEHGSVLADIFEKHLQKHLKVVFERYFCQPSTPYNRLSEIKKSLTDTLIAVFSHCHITTEICYEIGRHLICLISSKERLLDTIEYTTISEYVGKIILSISQSDTDGFYQIVIPLLLKYNTNNAWWNGYCERYSKLFEMSVEKYSENKTLSKYLLESCLI